MQDFFFPKINGDYHRVTFADIIYVKCLKNYVQIVTTKTSHVILGTMKVIEELLPQDQFCRVHRSYIVSLNHIDRFNGKSISVGERTVPLSDQYRAALLKKVTILTPEMKNRENSIDH